VTALYNAKRDRYFNIAKVIYDSILGCHQQFSTAGRDRVLELWLGPMINKMLVHHGFQGAETEESICVLQDFTWSTWVNSLQQRRLSVQN